MTMSPEEMKARFTAALNDNAAKPKDDKDETDNTLIGAGSTLQELKDKALRGPGNIDNKNSETKKSDKLDKVINLLDHLVPILKILKPHFADSRSEQHAKNLLASYLTSENDKINKA